MTKHSATAIDRHAAPLSRQGVAQACRYFAFAIAGLALVMSLLRYYNLETTVFDLGVYDHLAWRFAAYNEWLPTVTGHFRPITLLYGLAYKVAPHPFTLITLQWLAAVGAGLLFYRIAQHLLDTWHADVFVALYAINPIVLYQVFWDFHADHLIVLTFFAIFYILITRERFTARHRLVVGGLCVVSWLLKEPLILSVAFMGLFIAFYKKEWKLGIGVFVASLFFFYLVTNVLWPYFRGHGVDLARLQGDYQNLHGAFGYLGNSLRDALQTLLTQPATVLAGVFNDIGKAYYVAALLLPVAFLSLLSPIALLPALPAIGISLLSTEPNHYAPVHHYTASVVAPLFVAFLFAFRRYVGLENASTVSHPSAPSRLGSFLTRPRVLSALVVGSLFVSWAYSPLPYGRFFFMERMRYHHTAYVPEARDARVKTFLERHIPSRDEVTISVQNNLMYHPLLHRQSYDLLPIGMDTADYVIVDTAHPTYVFDRVQPEAYARLIERIETEKRLVAETDGS